MPKVKGERSKSMTLEFFDLKKQLKWAFEVGLRESE
jgi:hypothetical protein